MSENRLRKWSDTAAANVKIHETKEIYILCGCHQCGRRVLQFDGRGNGRARINCRWLESPEDCYLFCMDCFRKAFG